MSTSEEPDAAHGWLLSAGEVARVFGVRTQTVSRWADTGRLPSVRTEGGHRRFRPADVEELRQQIRGTGFPGAPPPPPSTDL